MDQEKDQELKSESNQPQDKHQQAKNDLDELLEMMSHMGGDKSEEQTKIHKVELPQKDSEDVQQQEETPAQQPTEGEQLAAEIMAELAAEKEQKEQSSAPELTPEELDAKEEAQVKEIERLLEEQDRRAEAAAPKAPVHSTEPAQKAPKAPAKKKKMSKKERMRRKKIRRMQRLGLLGVLLIIIVLLAVSCVRAFTGAGDSKPQDDGKGTSVSQDKDQGKKDKDKKKDDRPASQQESEEYLKIKDDTTLPSYALEYPGMYADAVKEPNKESTEKVCYLTFDDGPSSNNTPKILDIFKENDVKATFFIVTKELEGNEDILKRIIDEGHSICIHAHEHEYKKIYATPEAFLKDFSTAYDKLYEATGYRAQGFRFPGGSNNGVITGKDTYNAIIGEMTRRGFEYYDWNAYDHDAEGGNYTAQQMAEYAIDEVLSSSRNDTILLMHDAYGKDKTVEALPAIISKLKAEGIEMLPIDNSTRPVHFEVNENTPPDMPEITAEEEDSTSDDEDADKSDKSDKKDKKDKKNKKN